MTTVSVQSAHGSTVSLSYDSGANALLAQYVADAIANGIKDTSIVPADSAFGATPPRLLSPKIGEWVQDSSGPNVLIPRGYDFIVDAVPFATMTDQNPNLTQSVLVGAGNLNFNTSGAGSVIGGGGNDQIIVPLSDSGAWFIALGDGNDTIKALGSGKDTISLGAGNDSVLLGAGANAVTTGGAATISASTGSETVLGLGTTVIYGNGSQLTFVAGGGATVFGGAGSDTVEGGGGPDLFYGGSGGNNSITAGSGAATLFGGGNGDQLFAHGSGAQSMTAAGGNETLYAAAGNDTLSGGTVSGASTTFVAGTGAASVTANASGSSQFDFFSGAAGGSELVSGLTDVSQIAMHLVGYGGGNIRASVTTNSAGTDLNVSLSDGTQIKFLTITSPLTGANFV